jgi:hypothetical protein
MTNATIKLEQELQEATAWYFKRADSYQTSQNAYVTRLARIRMEKLEAKLEFINWLGIENN